MNLGKFLSTAIAALALSAAAQAQPIIGGISFQDGFTNLPTTPTTTVVSGYGAVQVGSSVLATSCSRSFTPGNSIVPINCAPNLGSFANDFTIGTGGIYFVWNGFTFNVTSITANGGTPLTCDITAVNQCSDSRFFIGNGTVSGNGLDPSVFLISWTATGNCTQQTGTDLAICGSNITGGWAASITATGRPAQVPEPGTLVLLGLGLAALGFARRKKA